METAILKKRLNTYKSSKGNLTGVDDEVVMEVLRTWENWHGKTSALYRELGLSKMQMVRMIQKAKTLVKNGATTSGEFKEIKVQPSVSEPGDKMELIWEGGKTIRFSTVSQLHEFLNMAGKNADV